jgi:hypothetical protein
MTSLYAAGTRAAALSLSFAAAATTVTPLATSRQIAACSTSPLVAPQFLSSAPNLATLMLTASNRGRDESEGSRCAAIQSRPQTYQERSPEPLSFRILTAQTRTPGATPTTPIVLSMAPTVPATCVPWPCTSRHSVRSVVEQL